MKLGPLQEMWVKSLEAHPERQAKYVLGRGNPKNYKACCLGELHLCYFRMNKKKLPFLGGQILDGTSSGFPNNSYKKYGLRSADGLFRKDFSYLKGENSLAGLNDNDVSWPEIAKIIRRNPSNVFTKSV